MIKTGLKYVKFCGLEYDSANSLRKVSKYECFCGKEFYARENRINTGNTKSCGCIKYKQKHGLHKTKEYRAWQDMKDRCFNTNNKHYKDYGGRGITVSMEWLDFTTFISDMGKAPTKNHSLDRIDNNGMYCKENCRWADSKTQTRNTRRSKLYWFNNKLLCLNDISAAVGIHKSTIWHRVANLGMTIDEAIKLSRIQIKRKLNE